MKIDELIDELEQVKEEHGNLEVKVDDDGGSMEPASTQTKNDSWTDAELIL